MTTPARALPFYPMPPLGGIAARSAIKGLGELSKTSDSGKCVYTLALLVTTVLAVSLQLAIPRFNPFLRAAFLQRVQGLRCTFAARKV